MNRIVIALVLCFVCCFYSCNGPNNEKDVFAAPDSVVSDSALEIAQETMQGIIQNVSSPLEMASLIKSSNAPFSRGYIAKTKHLDDYELSFDCALSLGILGADLGYLNLYGKTGSVVSHLTAIKNLSESLGVGQFFDFDLIKRLATNDENLDSLIYVSISSFNEMDQYLRDNNRSNLSSLIIAGVWVESIYLATQVMNDYPNQEISERIGEQKLILDDLIIILDNYRQDDQFKQLVAKLQDIKSNYDNVVITITPGESKQVVKDGMLTIVQTETSEVEINEKDLKEITLKIKKLRNEIIAKA
jgi:hypothetical protein